MNLGTERHKKQYFDAIDKFQIPGWSHTAAHECHLWSNSHSMAWRLLSGSTLPQPCATLHPVCNPSRQTDCPVLTCMPHLQAASA